MKYEVKVDDKTFEVELKKEDGFFKYRFEDGDTGEISLKEINNSEFFLKSGNENYHFYSQRKIGDDNILISHRNCLYEVNVSDYRKKILKKISGVESNVNKIFAPMPGKIVSIKVKEGDEVKKDTVLLVMEAMKMENLIKSPRSGKIKKIYVSESSSVEAKEIMVEFFEEKE